MRRVLLINGPNLGRLGSREPDIYGTATHADLAEMASAAGRDLGLAVEVRQTDDESELIGWIHEASDAGTPSCSTRPRSPTIRTRSGTRSRCGPRR